MYNFYNYSELFAPDEVIDYLRKSQSDDPLLTVEEVLSKHEKILDEWSERHLGAKVPEKNKFREVVSGETIKERPEINKVLRLIESPKYKAVKVVEPQRLTRGDLEDIGRLMKLLKHTNTYIITPERMYDLSDEYDWNAFEAELKRGNDYLKYTKKILNRGRLLSVSQGNYLGTLPPYGYDKTFVMDGKRKCPTLVENKEQADVVRMIFDMYANEDMGRTKICRRLDSLGIKPPKGEHWSPPAMKDMLENVHYIGKVKWNWRKTVTIVEDGEIKETRPKAKSGDYLIYEGKHEGIISEELFNAAQAKQGRNHRAKPATKVRNPFAGLLFCECGRAMSLKLYKNKDGSTRCLPRLTCDDQVHCKTGSCLLEEVTSLVSDTLQNNIKDFEYNLKNNVGTAKDQQAQIIKNLEKKLKNLNAKELAQWEQQSHPDPAQRMPVEIFKQLNEKLLKEKEETQQALREAHKNMPKPIDYAERLIRFQDALSALKDPEVDEQTKNRLLKACIDRMTYKRDKPDRTKSQKKTYRENGVRKCTSPLKVGGNWTTYPIDLDIKLEL